ARIIGVIAAMSARAAAAADHDDTAVADRRRVRRRIDQRAVAMTGKRYGTTSVAAMPRAAAIAFPIVFAARSVSAPLPFMIGRIAVADDDLRLRFVRRGDECHRAEA